MKQGSVNISLKSIIKTMIASFNACNHKLQAKELLLDKCHIVLYNSLVKTNNIHNKGGWHNNTPQLKLKHNLKRNCTPCKNRNSLHLFINLITKKYCVVITNNKYIYCGFSNNLNEHIHTYTRKTMPNPSSILDKDFKQKIEKQLESINLEPL